MSAKTTVKRDSYGLPIFTGKDYASFFASGALCCTLTHGAMTPVDVVKTRIQVDSRFKGMSLVKGARSIIQHEGASTLLTGFGPTAWGYLVQGGLKFAGYEYWKRTLVQKAGGYESSIPHRTAIYLAAAGIAEFIADIALTPLEATRIRLVSQQNYANSMVSAFARLAREEGLAGFYSGFIPIVFKQVPYAIGQFTVNEWAHEVVYRTISPETRKTLPPIANGGITLGCGIVAGICATILSQAPDTLLSQINKGKGPGGNVFHRLTILAKQAGFRGLFAGLGPRMVMTCFLVSGQFVLYKYIKEGLQAPEGVEIHKPSTKEL